jgi:O-antigen/teichoic acid export membrane protein
MAALFGGIGMLVAYAAMPSLLGESKSYLLSESRLALLAIPFSLLNIFMIAVLLGQGSYAGYNAARLLFYPIYFISILGLWAKDVRTTRALVLVFVCAAALTAMANLRSLARRMQGASIRNIASQIVRILSISGGNVTSFCVLICYAHIPLFLLVRAGASEQIGLFVVASSVASSISVFTGAASKVYFSEVARLRPTQDLAAVIPGVRRVFTACLAILAALELTAPVLIPVLFGAKFGDSTGLAAVLLVAAALSGAAALIDEILKASGNAGYGIRARLAYLVAVITGTTIEFDVKTSHALAIAMLVGTLAEFLIISAALARKTQVRISSVIIPTGRDAIELARSIYGRKRGR